MYIHKERQFPSTRAPAPPRSVPAQRPRSATLSRRELRRIIEEQIG